MDESPLIIELDDWTNLLTSPGWKHFLTILGKHQAWLDDRLHQCLRKQEFDEASRCQARRDDVAKIIEFVQKRVNELKNGPKTPGGN
jgi:hypothetical protein